MTPVSSHPMVGRLAKVRAKTGVQVLARTSKAAGDGTTGTSLEPGFYDMNDSRQVAATASCNSCHDEIAFHGGGRREIDYCTTCHNPDTIDANSTNSMDMPVLIHRSSYFVVHSATGRIPARGRLKPADREKKLATASIS